MFSKKLLVALGMLVSMLAQPVYGQDYNVEPGMWEMTYKMDVSGMPENMASMMQKEPKTRRECVTEEDISFKPENMEEGCTFNKTSDSSSKVVWEIECNTAQGSSSGHGEVNFHGTSSDGWFEMNVQAGPMGEMQMRNTFEGKRVGSC